jgi:NADPH:quinone reductase-like Zn-dependent oxidoreductase
MGEGLPETMRAVLLTGIGGYERLELRDDVAVPRPDSGDVLIKVGAAGVNNTDINTRIGWYSKAVAAATDASSGAGLVGAGDTGWSGSTLVFPRIQGADCCGRIVAVGEGVSETRIGERVLLDPLIRASDGRVRYFGSDIDGAFAEYSCLPARNALRIDSELSDVELASFPCAYSTAENILTRMALTAGECVLVTGASGGVGGAAVQLAKRRGAHVIAVAGAGKAEAVVALGADRVVPRDADLAGTIGDEQVDAVVDVAGGAQFPALLQCLKRSGRYGVSGAIAGPIVELDLRTLYLKDLVFHGCTVLEPGVFPSLVRYIAQREIRPVVAATYPLEQIAAAQRQFLEKRHVGKIVLTL